MIYNYSTKPEGGFRVKVKGSDNPIDTIGHDKAKKTLFYMGIENETCKKDTSKPYDYRAFDHELEQTCTEVYSKTDASIDGRHGTGLEVISRPCTMGYWYSSRLAERIAETSEKCGFNGDDISCGFHVHVSKQPFRTKGMDVRKVEASVVCGVDRFWSEFKKLSARRNADAFYYCQRTNRKTMASALEFVDWQKTNHGNRYYAINVQNKNTIEFRLWSGTSDPQRMKAYIALSYGVCCSILNGVDAEHCTFKEFINYDHLPSECARWLHANGLV